MFFGVYLKPSFVFCVSSKAFFCKQISFSKLAHFECIVDLFVKYIGTHWSGIENGLT